MTEQLKFALETAKQAGDILVKNFGKPLIKEIKNDKRDFATNMDIEIEKFVIDKIKKKYPKHKIISEECGQVAGSSDYTWIIDPLDGTRYYANGLKIFNVSIALWQGNEPLLGIVYFPVMQDLYFAEKGRGAFCNKTKLQPSKIDTLEKSFILLRTPQAKKLNIKEQNLFIKRMSLLHKNAYRLHAVGICALNCCFVARGFYEAYFSAGTTKIWDIAAALVIAKEAGCKITDLNGKFPGRDISNIVIGNKKIHAKFLKLLNNVK